MSGNKGAIDEEQLRNAHPKQLYEAILGNGKILSDQLLISSLYVMAFECLKDFIEDNFNSFFSDGFSLGDGGRMVYSPGRAYAATKANLQTVS